MADRRTFAVEFDDHLASVVDEAISSGRYTSVDDIAEHAMQDWAFEQRLQDPRYVEHIRKLAQQGLDSGEPLEGNFDLDDIRRRGFERLRRESAA